MVTAEELTRCVDEDLLRVLCAVDLGRPRTISKQRMMPGHSIVVGSLGCVEEKLWARRRRVTNKWKNSYDFDSLPTT